MGPLYHGCRRGPQPLSAPPIEKSHPVLSSPAPRSMASRRGATTAVGRAPASAPDRATSEGERWAPSEPEQAPCSAAYRARPYRSRPTRGSGRERGPLGERPALPGAFTRARPGSPARPRGGSFEYRAPELARGVRPRIVEGGSLDRRRHEVFTGAVDRAGRRLEEGRVVGGADAAEHAAEAVDELLQARRTVGVERGARPAP